MNTPATKPQSFEQLLEQSKGQIAAALPKHMTADRMVRLALTAFRTNAKLRECTPVSIIKSVMEASQLGLEPNVQGQAYLIPYGKECTMIPGYRGLLLLARRSGEIKSIDAFVVYQGDEFDVSMGSDPRITHKPKFQSTIPLYYYAVCLLKDGGVQFSIMSKKQVEDHRDRYSKQANGQAWKDSFDEMAKKTVLRRLCKMIPQSIELRDALQYEDERFTIDAEVIHTPEEKKEIYRKVVETESLASPSEFTIAVEAFRKLAAEANAKGVDTSKLYESPDWAIENMDAKKLNAMNAILKAKLQG